MRIADIQTAVIAANYDWTIIKITTDDGAVGYGESLFAPGLTRMISDFKLADADCHGRKPFSKIPVP